MTARMTMAMPTAVPATMKDSEAGLTASLREPAITAVWATTAAREPSATTIAARISVGRAQPRFGPSVPLKL